jgi:hypothetical protein
MHFIVEFYAQQSTAKEEKNCAFEKKMRIIIKTSFAENAKIPIAASLPRHRPISSLIAKEFQGGVSPNDVPMYAGTFVAHLTRLPLNNTVVLMMEDHGQVDSSTTPGLHEHKNPAFSFLSRNMFHHPYLGVNR